MLTGIMCSIHRGLVSLALVAALAPLAHSTISVNSPNRSALTTGHAKAAAKSALPTSAAFQTWPDIHGDRIVFTAEGDLFLGSISSGTAQRLTSSPGMEYRAHFSPDGTQIAFTASYEGSPNVYVISVDGGTPKRLTFGATPENVLGWTPDGKGVLYAGAGQSGEPVTKLFTVPVAGGEPVELPVPRGQYAVYTGPNELAYVPRSNDWANWYRYTAGNNDQIWATDLKSHTFKNLTNNKFIETNPLVCGGKLYDISEASGVRNLKVVADGKQVTHYVNHPVVHAASDGHLIIFEHGAGLAVYNPADGTSKDLNIQVISDQPHAMPQMVSLRGQVQSVTVGPEGNRIAVEARGQIVSVPVKEGAVEVIANGYGSRASLPAWSPDGKQIAFVSDRSGEGQIYVGKADGMNENPTLIAPDLKGNWLALKWSPDGKSLAAEDRLQRVVLIDVATKTAKIVDSPYRQGSYDGTVVAMSFSPDSAYLAFQRTNNEYLSEIKVVNVKTGEGGIVTDGAVNSYQPAFTGDGKYLAFLADRDPQQVNDQFIQTYKFGAATRVSLIALSKSTKSPFEVKNAEEGTAAAPPAAAKSTGTVVDFDGIVGRTIDVPLPTSRYFALGAAGNELLLVDQGEYGANNGDLVAFDLASKSVRPIANGVAFVQVSGKDSSILVGHSMNDIQVVPVSAASAPPSLGNVNLTQATEMINPRSEWKSVYEEGWRVARDFFYDPNMHGVDWNAVHAKYEAELSHVGTRQDVSYILQDMLSELSVGHCYVGGSAVPYTGPVTPSNTGYLGAVVTAANSGTNAFVKIDHILQTNSFHLGNSSPLASPGLNVAEGNYIVSLNGNPLTADNPLPEQLLGQGGQIVDLGVNTTASLTGARTITVRLLNGAQNRQLVDQDWVVSRENYVKTHGGADFGYVHIPDMETNGFIAFWEGQYPSVYKKGVIYDVRFNGGGLISGWILDAMNAKNWGWFHARDGVNWSRWGYAVTGPKVALCNEYCFSDAEYFSHMFKKMKIGELIGHRTGGGEVGSGGGYSLLDGGTIYVPNYGAFDPDDNRWIVEGHGVEPDIAVDQDPAKVLAGDDPQLDAAILQLKKDLAAHPTPEVKNPPFPDKSLKNTKQ